MREPTVGLILGCLIIFVATLGHALTLTPDPLVLPAGATKEMQVTIELPAAAGGYAVELAITGVEATAPPSVTILQGMTSASFSVVAGMTTGQGTISGQSGLENAIADIHVVELIVFDDGFESGDTSGWSSTFPPPEDLSIYDLQDITSQDHPAVGAQVTVRGVVCTAIDGWNSGVGNFWIQEPAGGMYSGIMVYNPGSVDVSGLSIGSVVDVSGTYEEYFDESEIVVSSLTVVSTGTAPVPEVVLPVDIATGGPSAEAFEGVLVAVESVTVTAAPDTYGEFEVTGGLLVDDDFFEITPAPVLGNGFSSLIGVMRYTFSDTKLEPRSAADVVP